MLTEKVSPAARLSVDMLRGDSSSKRDRTLATVAVMARRAQCCSQDDAQRRIHDNIAGRYWYRSPKAQLNLAHYTAGYTAWSGNESMLYLTYNFEFHMNDAIISMQFVEATAPFDEQECTSTHPGPPDYYSYFMGTGGSSPQHIVCKPTAALPAPGMPYCPVRRACGCHPRHPGCQPRWPWGAGRPWGPPPLFPSAPAGQQQQVRKSLSLIGPHTCVVLTPGLGKGHQLQPAGYTATQ